jgi:uncharacterized repeat protein (TIGR01451 family)
MTTTLQKSDSGNQSQPAHSSETPLRWIALTVVASLVFIPACALPEAFTSGREHVYSARSPSELDLATDAQPAVRADYSTEQALPAGQAIHADYGTSEPANHQAAFAPSAPHHTASAATVTASDRPLADRRITPASYEYTQTAIGRPDSSVIKMATFTQAEPRKQLPAPSHDNLPQETVGASAMAELYPDEYIFDGGDRDIPVHYHGGDRRGLETEDTIAEFTDHTGDSHVRPSNRVAVYAPRFGSVRSVSGTNADVVVNKAAGTHDVSAVGNLHQSEALNQNQLNMPLAGVDSRSRANGVKTSVPAQVTLKADSALSNVKIDQGAEGRSYTNTDTLLQSEVAVLDLQFLPAVEDSSVAGSKTSQNTFQASSVYATFRPQATVGVEDNRKRKGQVRIIKRADRETAQSGDIVTFTIDFRNVGEFEVHDVRIIDNLSPRLIFIEDSAQTSRSGDVLTAPNGEGSITLTFELDEPLQAQEHGTIVFSARVR